VATEHLSIHVPIPHGYWLCYDAQKEIDSAWQKRSREFTEFRGYVVSRGFDIENALMGIILHLLCLNRPPYQGETRDEFMLWISSRGFLERDLLRRLTFERKIEVAKKILTEIPASLKTGVILPTEKLGEARRWRNAFAHEAVKFNVTGERDILAVLKKDKGDVPLPQEQLNAVSEIMESCLSECRGIEDKLASRFGDVRSAQRERESALFGTLGEGI
jgi:hypothetical protein